MLVLHETSCFVNDCLIFSFVLFAIGFAEIEAIVADVDVDAERVDGGGGGDNGIGGVFDGVNDGVGDAINRSACIEPSVDFFGDRENDRKSL